MALGSERDRHAIQKWMGYCTRFKIEPDDWQGAYDEALALFQPTIIRSLPEVLDEIKAKIDELISQLPPGQALPPTADIMREHGFDPKIKSDVIRVNKYLRANGLLTHRPSQPEQFVKRLTNGGGPRADETAAGD
jgi:hypothetical protein